MGETLRPGALSLPGRAGTIDERTAAVWALRTAWLAGGRRLRHGLPRLRPGARARAGAEGAAAASGDRPDDPPALFGRGTGDRRAAPPEHRHRLRRGRGRRP